MKKYIITGMSCAACSARVEKAVSAVAGVKKCSVNLLTNTMIVDGDTDDGSIVSAVVAAGYGASPEGPSEAAKGDGNGEKGQVSKEIKALIGRLVASLLFLLPLMYLSMGHTMWSWPLPHLLANDPISQGLCQLLLSAVVIVINQKFFINGALGLLHRAPNMDTLVALGSGASFIYSLYSIFRMSAVTISDGVSAATHYLHELYFESAAMILTLITIGKLLEAISKGRTTSALRALMELSPKKATVLRNGVEVEIPITEVRVGEIFTVRPGESIPVDGVVLEGSTAIDESALTGESLPVDKTTGDKVSAGTINSSGFIKCQATRVGEDTTLSQIIKIVSDASASKAPISKVADRVSGIFVPTVLLIAAITAIVWAFVGESSHFIIARSISVLVISCPCALGLATPVAIMVGSGVGARKGILFKTAEALEVTGKAKTVVLDKTGTITKGEMTVTDVIPLDGIKEAELLGLAASLEKQSEHPLANAIVRYAKKMSIDTQEVSSFKAIPGKGIMAIIDGKRYFGGNASLIQETRTIPVEAENAAKSLAEQGKTPMYFACEERLLGIVAVSDAIKEDSAEAVNEMQTMGFRVVMLTGDNEKTARAIGKQVGVDEVIAGVLPDEKAKVIEGLLKQGRVLMVGDGINDAPALATADVGIAIGAGRDVAIDAADVVLMQSRLSDLPRAVRLSRATLSKIHQNLFWAFFYNVIGIPLAAGVWIPLWGWQLNPMFGALAMSLSSFCVVTNALLLNFKRIDKKTKEKNISSAESISAEEEKGDIIMTKTMKIEGMMCPHCSGRVKKCLEALEAVSVAEVSHESGTAIVTLAAEIGNDILKKTVEDQGYTVLSIE